jgi:hypothetical protein
MLPSNVGGVNREAGTEAGRGESDSQAGSERTAGGRGSGILETSVR